MDSYTCEYCDCKFNKDDVKLYGKFTFCEPCANETGAETDAVRIERELKWWKAHYEMKLGRQLTDAEYCRMIQLETNRG